MIEKVVKRDGRVVKFNKRKIRDAVENAFESAGVSPEEYGAIPSIIAKTIEESKKDAVTVNVDDIHKAVEKQLGKHGFKNVRKAYKSCRNDRDVARKAPSRKAFKEIIEAKPSDVTRENANMNADTPAGMMMKFASENTKSYVMDVLLSDDVKEAIENNYIHCHDLDYYPSKSLTCVTEDTHVTLKTQKGEIINTTISYLDKYFKNDVTVDGEMVEPNEYIYIKGRNGWTRITGCSRKYVAENESLYNIKTKKGLGLKVTGSHLIPVINSDNTEELLYARDITTDHSFIMETENIKVDEGGYIDIVDALLSDERITGDDVIVCNIRKLRKYLDYKYDIGWLAKEINAKTSRQGEAYLTLNQYNELRQKYYIPYEVECTLEVKMYNGKDSLPLYLPVTNELVELIGYLDSEGSIYMNTELSNYQISFCNHNPEMNKRFEKSFSSIFSNTIVYRWEGKGENKKEIGREFSSKMLAYLFTGYFGKKSTSDIYIPSFIFNASDDIKWHFISACIDGDGSIKDRQKISYHTVSERFANDMVLLFESLGVESQIRKTDDKGTIANFGDKSVVRNYDSYTLIITGYDNVSTVLENLRCIKQKEVSATYAQPHVKGNVIKSNKIVDKIEISKEGVKVYDIETVEHWFVANGYVVHNCLQHPLDKLFENGFVAGHGESRSPKRIETASIQACISMETIQNEMHGGQAIPAFDFYLAPYVRKTYIEEIQKLQDISKSSLTHLYDVDIEDYLKQPTSMLEGDELYKQVAINNTVDRVHQSMEAFVHNMNMIHSRGGKVDCHAA